MSHNSPTGPKAKRVITGGPCVGDFMILDAVRASGGTCIAVSDEALLQWMHRATTAEGISICPESAACIAAAERLGQSGWIQRNEKTVILNCAGGQKYPQLSNLNLPVIKDAGKVDFEKLLNGSDTKN